ncbi:MAG: hypothetical protein ACOCXA_09560 [Planctomycetota bacterium]
MRILLPLLCASCAVLSAESTGSVNISHPLVSSIGLGYAKTPWVADVELGFGGVKGGLGFGLLQMQGQGRGGAIAIKAVLMRTWESPIDSFWEDTSFYENNYFIQDRTYAGLELVVSPLPYRLAIGAYRLIGDLDEADDAARDFDIEEDDIVWGASLGMGF